MSNQTTTQPRHTVVQGRDVQYAGLSNEEIMDQLQGDEGLSVFYREEPSGHLQVAQILSERDLEILAMNVGLAFWTIDKMVAIKS